MAKRATPPCKCGFLGHYSGRCHCTPDQVAQYRSKISGPLLDRIDLQIEVPALPESDLFSRADGESSRVVRDRVIRASEIQLRRQGKPNARLQHNELARAATLTSHARHTLSKRQRDSAFPRARTIAC